MNRSNILTLVAEALDSGKITKSDLQTLMDGTIAENTGDAEQASLSRKTTAVDVMFYIAAIVLFAAIVALIGQTWDSGATTRILLSTGTGVIFWATALLLLWSPASSDIRRGMTNACLLAGALSLIAGGFIIANEFTSFDEANFYAVALTLALLGALHISFGWQIRRDSLVLIGVLLAVTAFPSLVFGLLSGSDMPMFVGCLVVAAGGGLLAYATRVVSWIGATSQGAVHAFDSLSAFTVLMSLYVASFDDGSGLLWLLALIAGIIGLFYLSIVKQDRLMLGNGSLFLVIAIITVSFRYFSGYGVATSLFIGATGLIGTAVVAATINRRYMK